MAKFNMPNLDLDDLEVIGVPNPTNDSSVANKKYIDDRVKTAVPEGAVFTDTVTTINGKTGAIAKADIVALGIPSQDTVYTHPANHPPSIITQNANNRFVTDTEKSIWNGKAAPSILVDATLTEIWSGSGPYTQSITVAGVTDTNNILVALGSTATPEQREVARAAMLIATAQSEDTITVTADGDKPTVTLPIQVLVLEGGTAE